MCERLQVTQSCQVIASCKVCFGACQLRSCMADLGRQLLRNGGRCEFASRQHALQSGPSSFGQAEGWNACLLWVAPANSGPVAVVIIFKTAEPDGLNSKT